MSVDWDELPILQALSRARVNVDRMLLRLLKSGAIAAEISGHVVALPEEELDRIELRNYLENDLILWVPIAKHFMEGTPTAEDVLTTRQLIGGES